MAPLSVEPPRIVHYREYPHPPGAALNEKKNPVTGNRLLNESDPFAQKLITFVIGFQMVMGWKSMFMIYFNLRKV